MCFIIIEVDAVDAFFVDYYISGSNNPSFKTYDHPLFNFYLGSYTHSTSVHWYYVPLWIGVTTPILILLLFAFGSCVSIFRIYRRFLKIGEKNDLNDLWRGPSELQDLIFIILIFIIDFSF